MKTKSFKTHLEQRLNKAEIKEIEKAAKIEIVALKTLQNDKEFSTIRNFRIVQKEGNR